MANNPFQTPASPWSLPPLTMGTIFATPTRLARAQARWATPVAPFATLKSTWNSGGVAQALTGFGHAFKYTCSGNTAEATLAYTQALAESFVTETDSARIYSGSAPYAYAWCKGALTSTQNSDLVTRIESDNAARETTIGALGVYSLEGIGNSGTGCMGYILGVIAINGQSGATDRRTNLRNLVQNMTNHLMEANGDGHWSSYGHLASPLMMAIIAYHIATGEESLLATRCPFLYARGEVLARHLSSDFNNYYRSGAMNHWSDVNHKVTSGLPDEGYCCAVVSEVTQNPVHKWVCDMQISHSSPTPWTHLQLNSDPTWLPLFFYDDSLTAVTPANSGIAFSNSWPIFGVAEFRDSWNQSQALVVRAYAGPNMQNDHSVRRDATIDIRVGTDWIIKDGGYAYSARNSATDWEHAVPISSTEVGGYTFRSSGFSATPIGSTREDRDGSAATSANNTLSRQFYPNSYNLTNSVRPTWAGGQMRSFYDDGTISKITADLANSFPQLDTHMWTIGLVKGNTVGKGTIVSWDQFSGAGVDSIRRNFWSFAKANIGGLSVLQGVSSAGVLRSNSANSFVITKGNTQATVQICSPKLCIDLVGGSGFESWADGYTSGGGNWDYRTHGSQTDPRINVAWPWIANNWRHSICSSMSASNGEMLIVITIDSPGTTAPVYSYNQAVALLSPAAPPPPAIDPSFLGHASSASTNTLKINTANTVNAGDMIIVSACDGNTGIGGDVSNVSDDFGNFYAPLLVDNTAITLSLWGAVAANGLPLGSNVRVNFLGANGRHGVQSILVSGVNALDTVSAVTKGTSNTPTPISTGTLAGPNEVLIGVTVNGGANPGTVTPGNDFVLIDALSPVDFMTISYKITSNSSETWAPVSTANVPYKSAVISLQQQDSNSLSSIVIQSAQFAIG